MCYRCKFFWGLDKKLKRNTTNLCYIRMKTYSPERGVNVKAILSASIEKRITFKERNQKIENCLRTILNYQLTYQCSASSWFFMLMMWRQCREKSHFSFWFRYTLWEFLISSRIDFITPPPTFHWIFESID